MSFVGTRCIVVQRRIHSLWLTRSDCARRRPASSAILRYAQDDIERLSMIITHIQMIMRRVYGPVACSPSRDTYIICHLYRVFDLGVLCSSSGSQQKNEKNDSFVLPTANPPLDTAPRFC